MGHSTAVTRMDRLVLGRRAGIIFNPSTGNTFTVQFLDPHPFLTGNIGQSIMLIQGIVNPAYNSQFVFNQLSQ